MTPSFTAGPYPISAVLSDSVYVRGTINEDKIGVPLTLKFKLIDLNNHCKPLSYASFYVWHCDKDGVYSGYSQPGNDTRGETFCRGIQDVNVNGEVTFHTIYPGWYANRTTHIHFQLFLYSDTAAVATATSQLAFPQEITEAVYNSSLYNTQGQNSSVNPSVSNGIFTDRVDSQMVQISGTPEDGFTATLTVAVAAP